MVNNDMTDNIKLISISDNFGRRIGLDRRKISISPFEEEKRDKRERRNGGDRRNRGNRRSGTERRSGRIAFFKTEHRSGKERRNNYDRRVILPTYMAYS